MRCRCLANLNDMTFGLLIYLLTSGRSGSVRLASDVCDAITVNCGVPQGSSFGPKLFIAYTKKLDEVLDQHHMSHHCFSDDTEAFVDVPRSQVSTVAPQLQNCIADMSNWCGARRLQVNPTKTEIIWFGSKASHTVVREHRCRQGHNYAS